MAHQRKSIRIVQTSVSIIAIALAATAATANPAHHGGSDDEDTPFVSSGPMANMEGMGDMGSMGNMGDHMGIMQSMMTMHQSMFDGMQARAETAALFKGTDPASALSTYDDNGDGVIDMDEFAAWDAAALRAAMVDRFQRLDEDGGSSVSLEELQAVFDGMSDNGMMHDTVGMNGMMNGAADVADMEAGEANE